MADTVQQPPYGYFYDVKTSGGAVFLAILFLAFTLGHIWKVINVREWYGLAIVAGGIFEFIGLSSRACSHATPARRASFAIQVVFIFLAPTFFVIALHMFLDRLIIASRHKDLSLIRLDRFLAIFAVGDCLSFIFQAFGVGQLVNARTQKGATLAGYVMLAGLAIQILLVFLLIICLVAFQVRVSSPYLVTGVNPNLQLKSNLLLLGLCSFLILIRTTTRLVEFQGHFGAYFKDNEWVVYVLDINLMLLFVFFALPWYSAGNNSTRLMHNYPLMPRSRRL